MARTYQTVNWEDGTILTPAKVTVAGTEYEVTPAVKSGTTPINANNLRHMDNEIKKIVEEDIPSMEDVTLLAVTDTAPSECSIGDKYYNTSDNKIYEAEDTDTWSQTGDYPLEGILYIVFSTQTSYAYDGTQLTSVGGGSGSSDIIIVGDESEATEDTKLVVEPDDLSPAGTEITNQHSESTILGYSAAYSNKTFGGTILWTNPSPTSTMAGSTTITLNSDDYDIYEVFFKLNKADTGDANNLISTKGIKGSGVIGVSVGYYGDGKAVYGRALNYVDSTHFSSGTCYGITKSSDTNNNDMCIPMYIIGYKTGLFS